MLLLNTFQPSRAADPNTLKPILTWDTPHRVNAVALSQDAAFAVAAGTHGIDSIWDAKTGKFLSYLQGTTDDSTSVAISPDNKLIGVGGIEGDARVFDLPSGKHKYTFGDHGSRVMQAAFSPDSKFFATSCWDGVIRWWNMADGKLAGQTEGCRVGLGGFVFSPDNRNIVAAWCERLARLNAKAQPAEQGHPPHALGFAFALRSTPLDAKSTDPAMPFDACIWSVAISDADKLFATGAEDGTVAVWSNVDGSLVKKWSVPAGDTVSKQSGIVALGLLPNHRVFAISMSGEGGVWDARTGVRLARLYRPTEAFVSASVAVPAQKVAVASWGKQVEVFDLRP